DPLFFFGAEDGILPGKSVEATMGFRDVFLRWTMPHRLFNWETLEEGVFDYTHVRITQKELMVFDLRGGAKLYSLGTFHLERLAQLTLAIHQVLEGLQGFTSSSSSQPFAIDPKWQLLRLMEENTS
ncbi:hypothetical protein C8R44DRAFT_547867, partial [Mycena epipterygia]